MDLYFTNKPFQTFIISKTFDKHIHGNWNSQLSLMFIKLFIIFKNIYWYRLTFKALRQKKNYKKLKVL